MKPVTTVFTILIVLTVVKVACSYFDKAPQQASCQTFASLTSEKMYACGMMRSYDGVSIWREKLQATFSQRNISDTECTTGAYQVAQMSCQQFEMLMNAMAAKGIK